MAGKQGRPKREVAPDTPTEAPEGDPGGRMVRVKSLLENPKGVIDTGPKTGPRSVEYGEEFTVREDLLSERWMEPLEEVNWDLSRARRAAAAKVVERDVVAGIRHNNAIDAMAFGKTGDQVLKGMAAEPPLPMVNAG